MEWVFRMGYWRQLDLRKDLIIQALNDILKPRGIVERNEGAVRKAEGMELIKGVVSGESR